MGNKIWMTNTYIMHFSSNCAVDSWPLISLMQQHVSFHKPTSGMRSPPSPSQSPRGQCRSVCVVSIHPGNPVCVTVCQFDHTVTRSVVSISPPWHDTTTLHSTVSWDEEAYHSTYCSVLRRLGAVQMDYKVGTYMHRGGPRGLRSRYGRVRRRSGWI